MPTNQHGYRIISLKLWQALNKLDRCVNFLYLTNFASTTTNEQINKESTKHTRACSLC